MVAYTKPQKRKEEESLLLRVHYIANCNAFNALRLLNSMFD